MKLYNYIYFYENDCSVITNKSILVIANNKKEAIELLKKDKEIVEDLTDDKSTNSGFFEQSAYSYWTIKTIEDKNIIVYGKPRLIKFEMKK